MHFDNLNRFSLMGEDHGGTGGTSPSPRIWSGGTLMQIVSTPPPRFCHIGAKMSVLWPLKYAKIRFRSGLCPGSRWESSRRSPRPLSPLERGHPSPYPIPLGTDPPSALAMRPPRSPARSTPMLISSSAVAERPPSRVGQLWTNVEDWN